MNQQSQQLLQKIDTKLDKLFSELEKLPEEKLTQAPSETAWSVMDVMHHLKLVEYHANAYVK